MTTATAVARRKEHNVPDSLKAGIWTAVFTFITGFGATLVGYLNNVIAWANEGGATPFPDPDPLRGALFSAGAGAVIGLVNFIVRWGQDRLGIGETPDYTPASPPVT